VIPPRRKAIPTTYRLLFHVQKSAIPPPGTRSDFARVPHETFCKDGLWGTSYLSCAKSAITAGRIPGLASPSGSFSRPQNMCRTRRMGWGISFCIGVVFFVRLEGTTSPLCNCSYVCTCEKKRKPRNKNRPTQTRFPALHNNN
jgi:hypothetical protein